MANAQEDIILAEGIRISIRAIHPQDGPAIQAFVERLSPESRYLRFLQYINGITSEEAERLANVDGRLVMAYVATKPKAETTSQTMLEGEIILGVARYVVADTAHPEQAEVGVVVEDAYQGKGIGTKLMARLIERARDAGICMLTGSIHPSNELIFKIINDSGFPYERRFNSGVWEVSINICR